MSAIDIVINGANETAREKWGVITTSQTLSALLQPAPVKAYVSNSSRLEDGKRYVVANPKVDSRDITLEIQLTAATPEEFYSRLESFVAEISKGMFTLSITDRPDVKYHMLYNSCTQFTQFCRGLATLSLKLTEPNPTNRS